MCSADIFLGVLALLFPPLPVWVKCGICSADSVINILLCMLGYVPGLLHAWYIIAKFPEPDYASYERAQGGDSERGHVSYVIVEQDENGRHAQRPRDQQTQPKPAREANMSYGTAAHNGHTGAGSSSSAPPPASQGYNEDAGTGPSDGAPPPSYAQVVAGDNKIQDQS